MQAPLARGEAVLVALLTALLVTAGCASAARASRQVRAGADASGPQLVVTPNWAGYVASAPVKSTYWHPYFTAVTGTWTVPTARCGRHRIGSSTVWVGLGGYQSNYRPNVNTSAPTLDQEEVGTDSNCTASGKQVYDAWFELIPYPSYPPFPTSRDTVSAGDTMTGLVKVISPTVVELKLEDRTRAWTFTTSVGYSSQDASTADWVVEAPDECVAYACRQANLANFGAVTMRNISAVGHGLSGTLTDPRWTVTRLKLVPGKLLVPAYNDAAATTSSGGIGQAQSPAGATAGGLSQDGSRFRVRWKPVSTRGL